MQVQKINNDNTNFNGYLHKSVYKYVNKAANNAINDLYKTSRKTHIEIDFDRRNKINDMRKETLELLQTFIAKTHPQTYVKIKNNKLTPPEIIITNKYVENFASMNEYSVFYDSFQNVDFEFVPPFRQESIENSRLEEDDLIYFNRFAKSLSKFGNALNIDRRLKDQTDEAMFEIHNSNNLFKKIKAYILRNEISRFKNNF